jgi:pimeloyl-ACP methyl ester carboxylesterase
MSESFILLFVSVCVGIGLVQVAQSGSEKRNSISETEINFPSGEVVLAGTLTVPSTPGPYPGVVLVTCGAQQPRDLDAFGFRPFTVLADHLAENGIAVLRYDKRGVGKSTGDSYAASLEDSAADALAAVEFLRGHEAVDSEKVGLCGHSDGGLVSAIAASRSPNITFLILLSAFGIPVEELDALRQDRLARARGASDEEVEEEKKLLERVYRAVRSGQFDDNLKAEIDRATRVNVERLPEDQRPPVDTLVESNLKKLQSPGFQSLLACEPKEVYSQVSCPVLALFGGENPVIPREQNAFAIEEALEAGGNPDAMVRTIPDSNHLFMKAKTGTPEEIPHLEREFAPGFLEQITSWILETRQ